MMVNFRSAVAVFLILSANFGAKAAAAKSWCASPLWVHEWGVNVFGADGAAMTAALLPSFFHRAVPTSPAAAPVRDLPADMGIRDLPVLHFYTDSQREVPVGIEVAFSRGNPTAWFPAVDALRDQPIPADQRRAAKLSRSVLGPLGPDALQSSADGEGIPTLVWDRLDLTSRPRSVPTPTDSAWIQRARRFDNALWVNGAKESERFVFYEGKTTERVPLRVTRAPQYAANKRAYLLTNHGDAAVHDIVITHREGKGQYVLSIATLAPGATTPFVLDSHPTKHTEEEGAARLRRALTGSAAVPPPTTDDNLAEENGCVMGRDPSKPFRKATGHHLYPAEVELILEIWGARFFGAEGTTIVYREDALTLERAMPVSIYTDMHNYVLLNRAGLALWQSVSLP